MDGDIVSPPKGMVECPRCNGHGSSLSETDEQCSRCGGSGLVTAPRRISELTPAEIEGVIAEYDRGMRSFTGLDPDRMREVADNADGEVLWEVVETAERMGYAVDESPDDWKDIDLLRAAVEAYQLRLRSTLPVTAGADDAGSGLPEHGS